MGTMVIVNFVLVVTYFPAVVVLYSKNGFEGRGIGAFVVFDVACALFFAVGLFCSLLVLVGPIGDQGSLRAIYEKLKGGDGGSVKVAPSSSSTK